MSKHQHYYNRVAMALDDLSRCRKYCKKMLRMPVGESFSDERVLYEALFVAFIVSYGRVFSTSKTVDKDFNEAVGNDFGKFRSRAISRQDARLNSLHERIMQERCTAIAHSDGSSRNYRHYGDSPLAIGRNPYYPYEHDEIKNALRLVDALIEEIGSEQSRVSEFAFSNQIFKSTGIDV